MLIDDFFSRKAKDEAAFCAQRSDYIKVLLGVKPPSKDPGAIWEQRNNYIASLLGVKPLKKDAGHCMSRGRDEQEEHLLGLIQNRPHELSV
jgi:hypothetical protein